MNLYLKLFLSLVFSISLSLSLSAQHDDHDHEDAQTEHHHEDGDPSHDADSHDHDEHDHTDGSDDHGSGEGHGANECGFHHGHGEFDPGATAFHHISDANVYSVGPWSFPLPCILYSPEKGWDVFLSNKFHFNRFGHGDGHYAYNGYILDGGTVKRITDGSFPSGSVEIEGITHDEENVAYACYGGDKWKTDAKSTADFGLFGGGISSFYDFSITKNVVSMILVFLFLAWIFRSVALGYKRREGQAPKGIQSLIEVVFVFIQDEVAKPFLGVKYMKYLPFLMALFFFILGLNLFGQIPFLGGSNVTGNLGVTLVLAVFAFLVTNLSGNKHYWEHVFWMPGVPAGVKLILTPVEFLGVFIKPLTLMLRLFANITAGHMVVVIFVSLIFMFSNNGTSMIGGFATAIPSALLTLFMMSIELLVAFIQAFVFTILTASYIGAAIEEPHH